MRETIVVGDGTELTIGEAQKRLNLSDQTVRNYVIKGYLRVVRWTAGGHVRIDPTSVDDLIPVLAMPPGPERRAAMEDLRRRNQGSSPAS